MRGRLQNRSLGPYVWTCIKVLISIGVMALLLSKVDHAEAAQFMHRLRGRTFTAAVCILFFASFLPAFRWRAVLHAMGVDFPLRPVVTLSLVGAFFNQVLPTSVGGDIVRAWYTSRQGVDGTRAAGSVLADRVMGLVALVIQAIFCLPLFFRNDMGGSIPRSVLATLGIMLAAIAGITMTDKVLRPILNWTQSSLQVIPSKAREAISHLASMSSSTRSLILDTPTSSVLLAYSLANQILVATVLYLIFNACGVQVTWSGTVLVFPYVSLVAMIPVSLAGWGIRETSMIAFFSVVHVPKEASFGVSILFGLTMLFSTLPGGLVWLITRANPRTSIQPNQPLPVEDGIRSFKTRTGISDE